MTIARRLFILLTVPLLALVGLGLFTVLQLANIEERSPFVAAGSAAELWREHLPDLARPSPGGDSSSELMIVPAQ
jgi:hypothetical protein